jgi:hypothetical protein
MANMKREPALQNLLDTFGAAAFGRTHTEAQQAQVCVCCGKPAEHFKDDISQREYLISGMCQICQDKTFG